jgi:hypothetical protein
MMTSNLDYDATLCKKFHWYLYYWGKWTICLCPTVKGQHHKKPKFYFDLYTSELLPELNPELKI